jgi:hypothetical protein
MLFQFTPPEGGCHQYLVETDNMKDAPEIFEEWMQRTYESAAWWIEKDIRNLDNWNVATDVHIIRKPDGMVLEREKKPPRYTSAELWDLLERIAPYWPSDTDAIRRTIHHTEIENFVRGLEEYFSGSFIKMVFEDELEDMPLEMSNYSDLLQAVARWRLEIGK